MHVAVISDLHLGAADAADGFGHDDHEFLRFLAFLEGNFERVVLLGDVWETLTSRAWGDATATLTHARAAHPELAAFLARPVFRWVHGNHDLCAGASGEAPEHLELDADGVRILFAHGHQGDSLVQRARPLSELGVWLGGWIRRVGWARAYQWFSRVDHADTSAARAEDAALDGWARRAALGAAADIVVTGHTHRARRTELGPRLLLNSGTCSGGRTQFVALDTRRAAFSLHDTW